MSQPPEDRRPPLTPQLALRVAVVGSFALAMFAIIFFRLWFLQVLSGQHYLAQASTNQERKIRIAAPRGEIKDRNGVVLVGSTQALVLDIVPPELPKPPRAQRALYHRLATMLQLSTKRIPCKVGGPKNTTLIRHLAVIPCDVAQQVAVQPYADAAIKEVNRDVEFYVAERQNEFPGVQISPISIPSYPQQTLAAQLLGTVGRITGTECWGAGKPPSGGEAAVCTTKAYRGLSANAVIGQAGLEGYYDRYLHGTDGSDQVQVNAFGQPTAETSVSKPIPGHNLALSLDANLERVGQQALTTSIQSNPGATGGAFVAMNPVNGEVYAMGSYPSFDPTVFTKTLSQSAYNSLVSPNDGAPLLNRAIQSAGPTGSTFKPITATAALQSGNWTTTDSYDDTGQFCFPNTTLCLHNAGHASNGPLDLVNAIRVSSDTFFYNLGYRTNAHSATHPTVLDQWARAFGIGHTTGIDLPSESPGTLPSPSWRAHEDQLELECLHRQGQFRHYAKGQLCQIADGRPWSVGDNVNLAVGQGDVQVTPLQLAVVYAALANGGAIVRPHLGLDVQDNAGTVLQKFDPPVARHININPFYLDTIRQGLRDAASQPGGTSYDVMGNFPQQVYGKTGTAQYTNQNDYSWYACFVPPSATTKPIVVVVHVERGGFGDIAAAPVARQILSQWFYGKAGAYKAGTSATL
jgi:penicillin-binding protein 2